MGLLFCEYLSAVLFSITCRDYERPENKITVYNPLAPSKEDLYYEGLCEDLPLHSNAPLKLAARSQREKRQVKPMFTPKWLNRDTSVPSFERPCSPGPYDVNRRAYLVNPHLPLAALGFTHCRPAPPKPLARHVYHFNSNSSAYQRPKDRIRLPSIYRDVLATKKITISDRFF